MKITLGQIRETGEASDSKIESLMEKTETTLKELGLKVQSSFDEASKASGATVEILRKDLEEWGNIRERVGEYKQTLEYAVLLFGILETPEALRKVPSSIVRRLMRRIYVWTSMMLPNETMKPSENMHDKEWNLSTFTSYKLPVVFEWCTEELEKRFRKEA